tara:strand:+ start:9445 stop:9648 length:204 start_codon:yes stop_codon:yes gene_type:complete
VTVEDPTYCWRAIISDAEPWVCVETAREVDCVPTLRVAGVLVLGGVDGVCLGCDGCDGCEGVGLYGW